MKRFFAKPFQIIFSTRYMIKSKDLLQDDLNSKSMYAIFLKMAYPALLESILIGVISFVDTLMVSTLGEASIAAVGLTTQPRMIFLAVITSLTIGVNAVAARRKGQQNQDGANRVLEQTLPIIFILALLFFAVSFIFSEPLLRFAGAKDDTIDEAISYYRITMLGLIFVSISLAVNAAQRGCGKTRISMTTNLVANVVNVIFNALLINGLFFFPKLGVTGAAIATALGNFCAMAMSLRSVRKKGGYLFLRFGRLFSFRFDSLGPVFRVFGGAACEQVFLRIGFFTFAKTIADLGTIEFATHQIGMTLLGLIYTVGDGLSVATSALVGQNLGKKRPDHALVYGKISQRIGWIFSAVIFTGSIVFRRQLFMLFSDDAQVIDSGVKISLLIAFISVAQIQQVMFSGCLRGAGDTRYMAFASLISVGILRPTLAYIFCYPLGFGLIGAWMSLIFDQFLRFALSATRFYGQKWCKVKL